MRSRYTLARPLAASLATALLAVAAIAGSPAQAATPEPPRPAFYETPAQLPAANGSLIRQEKLDYLLDVAGLSGTLADSRRVLYKSTNRTGKSIAVSGAVVVPKARWLGSGPRPVITVAPGTQGMADKCAPTRMFGELFEYEIVSMAPLLAQGYAVAVTDYEGLGTAGLHTYMDRVSQGRAVLDLARAVGKVGLPGITSANPVGIQGYSQGGGAAASAAELAPSYAPELPLKGVVASAVPADLNAVANKIDGTLYASFAYFAAAGLSESYSVDLDSFMNAKGKAFMDDIRQDCVLDLFSGSFKNSAQYTASGETLSQIMSKAPFNKIIDDQIIGRIKPTVPVLVTHSMLDDVVPYNQGRAMARSWCGKGAKVRFTANVVPTHVGGMVPHTAEAQVFWAGRFANRSFLSNCGWF